MSMSAVGSRHRAQGRPGANCPRLHRCRRPHCRRRRPPPLLRTCSRTASRRPKPPYTSRPAVWRGGDSPCLDCYADYDHRSCCCAASRRLLKPPCPPTPQTPRQAPSAAARQTAPPAACCGTRRMPRARSAARRRRSVRRRAPAAAGTMPSTPTLTACGATSSAGGCRPCRCAGGQACEAAGPPCGAAANHLPTATVTGLGKCALAAHPCPCARPVQERSGKRSTATVYAARVGSSEGVKACLEWRPAAAGGSPQGEGRSPPASPARPATAPPASGCSASLDVWSPVSCAGAGRL